LSTKIHASVDGLGNLVKFTLTGGEVNDCTQGVPLLEEVPTDGSVKTVTADKAYDIDAMLRRIHAIGAQAVIPSKANRVEPRVLDAAHYKSRNLIERLFCRLKQFRRFATRYDKLSERFGSFVLLAAIFVWLA